MIQICIPIVVSAKKMMLSQKKWNAKWANYVAHMALPIRTVDQTVQNGVFFLLLLLLLFMLWLFRVAKVWPISILLTAGQRGNVTLSHILQFATGAEEEPVLGFSIHPSIVFVDAENGFVPTANTCINSLKLVRPTISKPLPSEYALFKVFDYAFLNSYFGNM